MKITINVDCTPEEARRYMGLPDVGPMQEELLKQMQERLLANVDSMQPTEMLKTWWPMGMDHWLELQKALWTQMSSVAGGGDQTRRES